MDTQHTAGSERQIEIDPLGEPVISLGTIRISTNYEARVITDHQLSPLNKAISIMAVNSPGEGGAFVDYEMELQLKTGMNISTTIHFQHGPTTDGNYNGFTNEALLAILIHRLEGFQSGKFACEDNARALLHLKQAMQVMKFRTLKRIDAGVEGTHKV